MKAFSELTEQEVLALAITSEDEDSRIYRGFSMGLRDHYPASAKVFDEMAEEEVRHRTMLIELYQKKFGEYLPLIRRQDVKGFIKLKPLWLAQRLSIEETRKYAEHMEFEAERFYRKAAESARDASVRKLLMELAEIEAQHENLAHKLGEQVSKSDGANEEEMARRMFVLQYVQPGLAGLMDGSVSTLAPLFAAAFATHNTWETFLVGTGRVGRRRHFHGVCRGTLRRRLADRTRRPCDARRGHRIHDHDRRARPHSALSHSEFLDRDDRRGHRRCRRARGHLVHSPSLYGYAVPGGGVSGRDRRRAGVSGRHHHRQFVMTAFVLAHLSDPHLGPLPRPRIAELAGKRAIGYLNWWRKRGRIHSGAVLARIVADLKEQAYDHLAVTGDLVNLSLPREYAPALAWLESLGPARDVTLVPGNHDAYVWTAARYPQTHWSRYLYGDDAGEPADGARAGVSLSAPARAARA